MLDFDGPIETPFEVTVGGVNVTSGFRATTKSITVNRAARKVSDTADITLADPDGSTFMPPTGAPIQIMMGLSTLDMGLAFDGFVDTVRSTGSKSGGREISIKGNSVDNKSKVKAPGMRSEDKNNFEAVAKKWGGLADLDIRVAGDLAGVERDFWLMQNESFMQWGHRIAGELGGAFKIIGKSGYFAPLNEGISATGKPLTAISAAWGVNLLSWDVAPIIGRPQYGKIVSRHYDLNLAKYVTVEVAVDGAEVDVDFGSMFSDATEAHSKQTAKAKAKESEREKGEGSVSVVGDYAAEPEAPLVLSGARPGVDGTYTIDSLVQKADKKSGFVTDLKIKRPTGGAGKDSRGSSAPTPPARPAGLGEPMLGPFTPF
ncbi:phage late control D family protein [Maritalea porphyrae]|uniref:phage late control D family protein n=1 Tax=Maritalea porphyrae TaxID=880732 RepID=UPI0022AF1362|nr:hypothetical protein [Maritalea porphyrae]MCZ4273227.1 hypothetical protein [Maritalea porphyrae]